MVTYEDENGQLVHIPVSEVQGEKKMSDGSIRFKFIGGPIHDKIIRVYPPYDQVVFPPGDVYDLSPPLNLKRSKKWVYVYNQEQSHMLKDKP